MAVTVKAVLLWVKVTVTGVLVAYTFKVTPPVMGVGAFHSKSKSVSVATLIMVITFVLYCLLD
jgi:hypothetical protein